MFNFPDQYSSPTSIVNVKNFLDLKEINDLLKFIKALPYTQGTVKNSSKFRETVRSSNIKWVPHSHEFKWLYHKCIAIISEHNSYTWKFDLKGTPELFQYTEYDAKQRGQYNWHVDTGSTQTSHRKISITIQLSDPSEYEGGYLQLFNTAENDFSLYESSLKNPYYIKSIKKERGMITIFPSFMPHRVTPVTKGIRRSLVLWVGGCPFR